MRNVSDKTRRENQNTFVMLTFFFFENRAVYEKCRRIFKAGQTTDYTIIWRMRIACWITKATNTHSEYMILLIHRNSGYANAPQCYFTGTSPALSFISQNL